MSLAALVTMLQTVLTLLTLVQAHPEIEQSIRDTIFQIAEQAITEATAALSDVPIEVMRTPKKAATSKPVPVQPNPPAQPAPIIPKIPTVVIPPAVQNTIVTAQESVEYQGYHVTITITIPLAGGTIHGSFSGDCNGTINGTYAGGNGGAISGSASGTCTVLYVPVPISGGFTGTVNRSQRSVTLVGSGDLANLADQGELTLNY